MTVPPDPAAWQPPQGRGSSTPPKVWPLRGRDWIAFACSAVVGIAIWWPTMAMQPRVDYDHPSRSVPSAWYLPLMIVAPLVLGAVLRRWNAVGLGLLAPQFLVAASTTPRGDNDGLFMLVYVELVGLLAVAFALAWLGNAGTERLRHRTTSGGADPLP